jgi:hypothetical protein
VEQRLPCAAAGRLSWAQSGFSSHTSRASQLASDTTRRQVWARIGSNTRRPCSTSLTVAEQRVARVRAMQSARAAGRLTWQAMA